MDTRTKDEPAGESFSLSAGRVRPARIALSQRAGCSRRRERHIAVGILVLACTIGCGSEARRESRGAIWTGFGGGDAGGAGGGGADGGSGGIARDGGAAGCAPGEIVACYTGPAETLHVGLCAPGTQVCNAEGTAYGPCIGEVTPAPELCATLQDDDCNGLPDCAGAHVWSHRFEDLVVPAMVVDAAGDALIAGTLNATVDFGGGPLASEGQGDIFVAKFDPDGNHLWSKRFGDSNAQGMGRIAVDGAGNVLLTGSFSGTLDFGGSPLVNSGVFVDIFLAKLDPDGNHIWSKQFGDAKAQFGIGIAADGEDNVLITGSYYSGVDFGGGPLVNSPVSNIFVAKFDPNGNHLWSKGFGDANFQTANGITADGNDNVLITGTFYSTVDFGGGPLASTEGSEDIFVAKLNADGGHLWSNRFGDSMDQSAINIAAGAADHVVLTGEFTGDVDFGAGPLSSPHVPSAWIASLDANGKHLWSKQFGQALAAISVRMAVDATGNTMLTGYASASIDFGGGPLQNAGQHDIFVVKLRPDGSHVWSKLFGDAEDQQGSGIAVDKHNNVLLSGYFWGTVDFGGGSLSSAKAAFLAKLNPCEVCP